MVLAGIELQCRLLGRSFASWLQTWWTFPQTLLLPWSSIAGGWQPFTAAVSDFDVELGRLSFHVWSGRRQAKFESHAGFGHLLSSSQFKRLLASFATAGGQAGGGRRKSFGFSTQPGLRRFWETHPWTWRRRGLLASGRCWRALLRNRAWSTTWALPRLGTLVSRRVHGRAVVQAWSPGFRSTSSPSPLPRRRTGQR